MKADFISYLNELIHRKERARECGIFDKGRVGTQRLVAVRGYVEKKIGYLKLHKLPG